MPFRLNKSATAVAWETGPARKASADPRQVAPTPQSFEGDVRPSFCNSIAVISSRSMDAEDRINIVIVA